MQRALCAFATVTLAAACSSSAASDHPPTVRTSDAVEAPAASPTSHPSAPPTFRGSIGRIAEPLRARIVRRNWHPGCPVPLQDLRVVMISYWGFDGLVHEGPLVVNQRVAEDILGVFRRLFRAHFAIKRVDLARKYHPKAPIDWNSKRDVTAGFNCRPVTERPGVWSQHAYGLAVDINPLQNPYVRSDGSVLRKAAKPFRDRSLHLQGMIHPGDVVVRAFARIGWGWGGHFTGIKDYMHFSANGK